MAFWGYVDNIFVGYPGASEVLTRHSHSRSRETFGGYWEPGRRVLEGLLRDVVVPKDMFADVERVEYEPGISDREACWMRKSHAQRALTR